MFLKHLQVVIAALLSLALIVGAVFVVVAFKSLADVPYDAYASDWTDLLIREYIKTGHGGMESEPASK